MAHEQPSSTPETTLEEHVVSPAVRRKLQQCYEHGSGLMSSDSYDFDYANTMFTECVVHDPSNLVYVEAFLENLQRKYQNNKRGGRLLGFGGKGPFRKAVAREDWREVLKLGPPLLKTNPWDVAVLRGLARACEAFHYNEVELRYLKNALDANPKDPEVNRHCAQSLARMGQFDQAIACWHRVEEARRHDPEAPQMISALTLERARIRAGLGSDDVLSSRPAGTSRAATRIAASMGSGTARQPSGEKPTAADLAGPAAPPSGTTASPPGDSAIAAGRPVASSDGEDHPAEATPRRRQIVLTPRQKLERAVVEFPEILENYLQLAELHLDEHRPADAEKVLTKALAVSGGDVKVREKLEEATAQRLRHQLAIAEQRADVKQTAEARELVEQIRQNLLRYEMEVLQSRAQRYPQDELLRFQLARRLKWIGNYQEAAELFQQVERDTSCKAAAQLDLGECRQHLKQYPKALLAYEHAIEAAEEVSQLEVLKLALYRAGVLAAALRQVEAARRHFLRLAELDPDYKDARDRLDKLTEIDHKE